MRAGARSGLKQLPIRVFWLLALGAAASLGLFALLHALPGDPVSRLMFQAANSTADDAERLRRLEGLDEPIIRRYGCWLLGGEESPQAQGPCRAWPTRGVLRGDLGRSRQHGLPVSELLGPRLWVSLSLMGPGFLLGLLGALLSGLWAARARGALDAAHSAMGVLALSAPTHWLGLMLICVFAIELRWLPSGGLGDDAEARLYSATLPVLTLAGFYWARFSRFVRNAAVTAERSTFIATLRARGVPEGRLWRGHVLRHALLPLIPVVGQALPGLFSGSLIIERVFSIPGLGVLFFDSIENDDPMVAMAVLMLVLIVAFLVTSLVEVAHYVLDPRTRGALSEGALS